jgi:hypothetical protein
MLIIPSKSAIIMTDFLLKKSSKNLVPKVPNKHPISIEAENIPTY